jgi:hypothetical protein
LVLRLIVFGWILTALAWLLFGLLFALNKWVFFSLHTVFLFSELLARCEHEVLAGCEK